jgi:predicted HicB family RNase H-like nuclease
VSCAPASFCDEKVEATGALLMLSQQRKVAALYPKFVEWSTEDKCFIGRCPDLFDGGVHGTDEAQVYKRLVEVSLKWVQILQGGGSQLPKTRGRSEYSGKFIVRVSPAMHQRLVLKAKVSGESLNAFVARSLQRA